MLGSPKSVSVLLVLLLLALCPASARSGNIYLSDCAFGFHDEIYGIHEQVCVTGDLDCLDDWIYPIGLIYIVVDDGRVWSTGMSLSEAMGAPNPVNGTGLGGAFYDVPIALPPLPLGRFDIIIDENEDGVFNSCAGYSDYVLGNGTACAFQVLDMGLVQIIPTDEIKAQAATDAAKWDRLGNELALGIQAVSVGLDVLSFCSTVASTVAGGGTLAVGVVNGLVSHVVTEVYAYSTQGAGYKLIRYLSRNIAAGHAALALDPPDPAYLQNVVLGVVDYPAASDPEPLSSAQAAVYGYMSEESALLTALLGCLEKYTGASAVPDNQGVRLQALALLEYTGLLEDCLAGLDSSLMALRSTVDSLGYGSVVLSPDSSVAFRDRVATEGFHPEEISLMIQRGFESLEIDSLEASILRWDLDQVSTGSVSAYLDSTIQSCRVLLPVIEDVAAAAQTAIDTTSLVWLPHPFADAGGPYVGNEGDVVQLDGSASTDPRGGTLVYEWDLDADGVFDDGIGSAVSHTWFREGDRLIALKVANTLGYSDVGYARVRLGSVNDGPLFQSAFPEDFYVDMVDCRGTVFGISAVDPDGDPLQFWWTLDDSVVSAAEHWAFHPAFVSPGRHQVRVVVGDGSPLSPTTQVTWRVDVPFCEVTGVPPTEVGRGRMRLELAHLPNTASVEVAFDLSLSVPVTLAVFDVTGREVTTLVDAALSAGTHRLLWNARDRSGRPVPRGVYWFRLQSPEGEAVAKTVLVR